MEQREIQKTIGVLSIGLLASLAIGMLWGAAVLLIGGIKLFQYIHG